MAKKSFDEEIKDTAIDDVIALIEKKIEKICLSDWDNGWNAALASTIVELKRLKL